MKLTLLIITLLSLFIFNVGCASLRYSKAGSSPQDDKKALFECTTQARMAGYKHEGLKRMVTLCMEGKGYTASLK